ncbi:hypothetical protein HFN68_02620 [Rhizobium laguerreae]|uniref:hypothetical protein n=1 Tax=Rhizobium laguerreae TaxID=1076926 RepID=UPI001C90C2E7|nr:hypothetical protein [Rhizobium laguerreae]MBY3531842.1 hypothetical protein [Rhizobium laguerreae]
MNEDSKRRERRRRTCVDEMRRDLARRRERRADPATKTLLQLLTLLSAVLAVAQPSEPAFDITPRPHRRTRYDPPPGYPNGRDAWARERGLDPQSDAVLAASEKPEPRLRPALKSWRRLVHELGSPSPRRREEARVALERRLPSVVHEWLRKQATSGDHTQLRVIGLGAGPAELVQRALTAARVESIRESELSPSPAPEMDVEDEVEEEAGPGPGRK